MCVDQEGNNCDEHRTSVDVMRAGGDVLSDQIKSNMSGCGGLQATLRCMTQGSEQWLTVGVTASHRSLWSFLEERRFDSKIQNM